METYNFIALGGISLRADVSKYRPEVCESEKSKILKKNIAILRTGLLVAEAHNQPLWL